MVILQCLSLYFDREVGRYTQIYLPLGGEVSLICPVWHFLACCYLRDKKVKIVQVVTSCGFIRL